MDDTVSENHSTRYFDEDKPVVVPPILDELVEDEDEGDIYPGESMASR